MLSTRIFEPLASLKNSVNIRLPHQFIAWGSYCSGDSRRRRGAGPLRESGNGETQERLMEVICITILFVAVMNPFTALD